MSKMIPFPCTNAGVFEASKCIKHAKENDCELTPYQVEIANRVLFAVAQGFRVQPVDILTDRRTTLIALAKCLFAHFMRIKTSLGYKTIGGFIGRDHSSTLKYVLDHSSKYIVEANGYKDYCTALATAEKILADIQEDPRAFTRDIINNKPRSEKPLPMSEKEGIVRRFATFLGHKNIDHKINAFLAQETLATESG